MKAQINGNKDWAGETAIRREQHRCGPGMQVCDVVFNPPETRHDIGERLPYVSTQLLPLLQPLVGRVELNLPDPKLGDNFSSFLIALSVALLEAEDDIQLSIGGVRGLNHAPAALHIQASRFLLPNFVVTGYHVDASEAADHSAWGNFYEEKGRGRAVMKTEDEGWQKAKSLVRHGAGIVMKSSRRAAICG